MKRLIFTLAATLISCSSPVEVTQHHHHEAPEMNSQVALVDSGTVSEYQGPFAKIPVEPGYLSGDLFFRPPGSSGWVQQLARMVVWYDNMVVVDDPDSLLYGIEYKTVTYY